MSSGCDNNPKYNDDDAPTHTSTEQRETELKCQACYLRLDLSRPLELVRGAHSAFLSRGFEGLPARYQGLDNSRPWMCYWMLNSMDVLGQLRALPPALLSPLQARTVDYLTRRVQHPRGGFQGGPAQLPHLAPTYAATNALVALGSREGLRGVDRQRLYDFLAAMKTAAGPFRMHDNGEIDVRATYCAVAVASVFNLLSPQLLRGVPEFLARCQGFDGGVAGEPGNEPHGGYSFCGLAAACIVGDPGEVLDLERLLHWAAHRQTSYEGGFQGRTNKLVDSCYSFWCGALFPLLGEALGTRLPLFSAQALQRYLLGCAQEAAQGGFRDKPGTSVDFYHTCYALNGLAIASHAPDAQCAYDLLPIDPAYGVCRDKLAEAKAFFAEMPLITSVSPDFDPTVYSHAYCL